jgi:predicted amidohydrolase
MENLRVSTAQFENKSGDKTYNLERIRHLAAQAAASGSDIISFHECSITGYTFARHLSKPDLLAVSEFVPLGQSTQSLISIATSLKITILAGLFEKDTDNRIYNTYICVDSSGFLAKYRKLHPFISNFLSPGNEYVVFDLHGWKAGILICYDNNIIENVRATALLGAQIIFMPHVTMCTPSTRPGAGFVDARLWKNRELDATSVKEEFSGLKGKKWLMKWLPSRAYDNAVYVVFSNPIGLDDDQVKNGCSMVLDPYGDVIAECTELNDQVVTALCVSETLRLAGGSRYKSARRPDLYRGIIGMEHRPELKVNWIEKEKKPTT